MQKEKKPAEATPSEKRERRFETWLSPSDVKFNSPDAEKAYKARVSRFIAAIKLEEPDRVPLILPAGTAPIYNAGSTLKEAMYDSKKTCQIYKDFLRDFEADTFTSPMMVFPGRSSEIIDSLSMRWPGHGAPDDATMHQFVEGEYMKADEYDLFINDLSDFCFRCYLPRTLGALKPFADFDPLPYMLGMPNKFLMPAIMPHVQAAFQAIIDYGKESAAWSMPLMQFTQEALAAGHPLFQGGFSHAPFDILADTLRGTRGIVMDLYRQPEKVHEAMEKITPMLIESGVKMAEGSGKPLVFMPLHKGDDSFMSEEQYETFYWPSFRKVLLGLIKEGCVPLLFAEGRYSKRLNVIKDLPKTSVVWWFDQTDMTKAKEILGDVACISGNVPTSLLCTGMPHEVKEYCRKLIEVCGKNGGFILTGGAAPDKCDLANLRAMIDAVNEYGVYR
jgi:uroporphyrinogen-III decarboxylase